MRDAARSTGHRQPPDRALHCGALRDAVDPAPQRREVVERDVRIFGPAQPAVVGDVGDAVLVA
jgi:hypothetical protein